jgi:hypothetical protein
MFFQHMFSQHRWQCLERLPRMFLILGVTLIGQVTEASLINCPSAPATVFPGNVVNPAFFVCEPSSHWTAGYGIGTASSSLRVQGYGGADFNRTDRISIVNFVGGQESNPLRFGLSRQDINIDMTEKSGVVAADSFDMPSGESARAKIEYDFYSALIAGGLWENVSFAARLNSVAGYFRSTDTDDGEQDSVSGFSPDWSLGWRKNDSLIGLTVKSSLVVGGSSFAGIMREREIQLHYQRYIRGFDYIAEVNFHNYSDLTSVLDDKLSYSFQGGYTESGESRRVSRFYLNLALQPAYFAEVRGLTESSIGSTSVALGWMKGLDTKIFLNFWVEHVMAAKKTISEDGITARVERAGQTSGVILLTSKI